MIITGGFNCIHIIMTTIMIIVSNMVTMITITVSIVITITMMMMIIIINYLLRITFQL